MKRVPFVDTPEAKRIRSESDQNAQLKAHFRVLTALSFVHNAVSFLIGFCIGAATILLFNRFH